MQSTLSTMSQMSEKTDQNLINNSQSLNQGLGLTKKIKMPVIMHKSTTLYQTFQENLSSKENKGREKESVNTREVENKLFSLHNRLRQEAEKIREWKLSSETECKQKDVKIGILSQTIENLRKSLIDLQVENENLSQRMQDEVVNREEILKKIDLTRKMCAIVKDHSQSLENKVMQCEAESNELKYKEREHFEKFEELSVKFNELNISAKGEENKLKNEMNHISLEKEKQRKCLEKRIEDMQNIIEELQNEITCGNRKMDQLHKAIHDAEEEKNKIISEYEESKKSLSELEFKYTTLKLEYNEKTNEVTLINTSFENSLKDQNEAYEKLEKEYGELHVKYTSANKIIEDLKSDKDILILEKAQLNENLKEEINQKNNLQVQMNSKSLKITSLNSNILSLNDEIFNANAKSLEVTSTYEKTKEKLKAIEEEYKILNNESKALKDILKEKGERLNIALKNMEELEKTSSAESNDLNKIISELKDENNLLRDQQSNLETKIKCKETEYSSQINTLNKNIEENAMSANKNSDLIKDKDAEIKEYKQKLQILQTEIDEYQKEKVVLMGYQEELKQMTILKNNTIQEKERIYKESENQKEEMISSLEKYKKENQKIFDIKAKEISLKGENEIKEQSLKYEKKLKETKSEFEKEISQYKDDISGLEQNIQIQKNHNTKLEEKVDILLKEKEELTKQIYENSIANTGFPKRRQSQVAVLMTPQLPLQRTPRVNINSVRSNSLTSRKRKVVFNSDDATLVSDSDSSMSEYHLKTEFNSRTPLLKFHQKNINTPSKENTSHSQFEEAVSSTDYQPSFENNISSSTRKLNMTTKNNSKNLNIPEKQIQNNGKQKKANGKKNAAQSGKKFFKSPKSKKSPGTTADKYAWFDMDSVFGFGSDN